MQSFPMKRIPKEKSCPSCNKHLRDGFFSFDDDLNLICGFCGGFVFSTKEKTNLSNFNKSNLNQFNKT